MKVVTVLGARPQFIKAGTVSRAFAQHSKIQEVIVHTGQHYDSNMSDVFFDEMKIPRPDYFLGIGGRSHGAMTGQMIEKIEEILVNEEPDWVLVYGDTNSTLAGAVAASKLHIKIAHIEAGLRSFNMKMPEEVNRILTDRISTFLFCPTQTAMDNLDREGASTWKVQVALSGDVMQDGALFYKEVSKKPEGLNIDGEFVLATIHRAENTDDPERLAGIVRAVNRISKSKTVVLPLHPRTKAKLLNIDVEMAAAVTVIEPVGYLSMVWLIDNCQSVLTDSGGLQKEAFFFGKSCVTLRDETEWVELVDNNFNVLAGAEEDNVVDVFENHQFATDFTMDLYGGGKASSRIVEELLNYG